MNCPNCKSTRPLYELTAAEAFAQCLGCGWMVCQQCSGTGAVSTPFSGSDPSCGACDGEGAFDPNYETTEIKLGNPDRRASQ